MTSKVTLAMQILESKILAGPVLGIGRYRVFEDTGISVFFGIEFLKIPVFRYLSVSGFGEYRYFGIFRY